MLTFLFIRQSDDVYYLLHHGSQTCAAFFSLEEALMTSLALSGHSPRFLSRFGMKQVMAMFVALATISATVPLTSSDADARHRRGRAVALVGAGLIGGLALGALAAESNRNRAYGYNDGYYQRPRPRPRYVEYNDGYYQRRPVCRIRYVRTYDDYGNTYRQRVRVCR
jgi:hypothetical protein